MSVSLPTLETERLVLRIPGPDDAERLVAYHTRNRDHLAHSGPLREDAFFTLAAWQQRVTESQRQAVAGESAIFGIWRRGDAHGAVVGSVGLTQIVRGPAQRCSLGYGLDAEAEGQGYMTEALRAVIAHAFETLKLHRVEASYMPTNERSGRVLRRLGFTVEGFARDYVCLNGRWQDHILTALINPADQAPVG